MPSKLLDDFLAKSPGDGEWLPANKSHVLSGLGYEVVAGATEVVYAEARRSVCFGSGQERGTLEVYILDDREYLWTDLLGRKDPPLSASDRELVAERIGLALSKLGIPHRFVFSLD